MYELTDNVTHIPEGYPPIKDINLHHCAKFKYSRF
jgi:hypothetical protein